MMAYHKLDAPVGTQSTRDELSFYEAAKDPWNWTPIFDRLARRRPL